MKQIQGCYEELMKNKLKGKEIFNYWIFWQQGIFQTLTLCPLQYMVLNLGVGTPVGFASRFWGSQLFFYNTIEKATVIKARLTSYFVYF